MDEIKTTEKILRSYVVEQSSKSILSNFKACNANNLRDMTKNIKNVTYIPGLPYLCHLMLRHAKRPRLTPIEISKNEPAPPTGACSFCN